MGKHCQLVMGPAGSGKSTYCKVFQEQCQLMGRTVHVINMDPACEQFSYTASGDVRDLITVDEVLDEQLLGPNGGLIYVFEYMLENSVWLEEQLGDFAEDYVILDLPGQIELFTHVDVLPRIISLMQGQGYHVGGIYLMDSTVVLSDVNKYVASTFSCLSAMLTMEIPHVNLLSKIDLTKRVAPTSHIAEYINGDWERLLLDKQRQEQLPKRLYNLTAALGGLLDQFPLVTYQPLDITDLKSISSCIALVDRILQFEDDEEGRQRKDPEQEEPLEIPDEVVP
eukprot:TRINITY_DN13568_c0_g1_i1.p1 TRINITY_DN13568_c0_g1~~TRINITY_DN13568_c0_g1_i1.p1  ORF type:complete len:328 (+),score=110.06 TRINITY_DN13568_c0_g1_i1:140-985(+)